MDIKSYIISGDFKKSIKNKISEKAEEAFSKALNNLPQDVVTIEDKDIYTEALIDIYIEALITEITNNLAEFVSSTFKWQKNLTPNHLKDYAEYINEIASLIEYILETFKEFI